jgi:hypothetical protein
VAGRRSGNEPFDLQNECDQVPAGDVVVEHAVLEPQIAKALLLGRQLPGAPKGRRQPYSRA